MRGVISTNMLRFLWTARQSVYFSKSVKCKSSQGVWGERKKVLTSLPSPSFPASYPSLFALSEWPEEAFPTSLTGDVTSEIAEDDWERGYLIPFSVSI